MKLVFATNNKNKILEVQQLLTDSIEIISLENIGCFEEIPETGDTIEENAIMKANYVTQKYGYNCFADDTGLEVDALNGAPGVFSARAEPVDVCDDRHHRAGGSGGGAVRNGQGVDATGGPAAKRKGGALHALLNLGDRVAVGKDESPKKRSMAASIAKIAEVLKGSKDTK